MLKSLSGSTVIAFKYCCNSETLVSPPDVDPLLLLPPNLIFAHVLLERGRDGVGCAGVWSEPTPSWTEYSSNNFLNVILIILILVTYNSIEQDASLP